MIDPHFRSHLLNDVDISTAVGASIYALRLPQGTTTTSIVFEISGGHRAPQTGSMETVIRHDITLLVYSPSYETLRELSGHIDQLLNGMHGPMGTFSVTSAQITSAINTYEEELKLYRNIISLTIYTN